MFSKFVKKTQFDEQNVSINQYEEPRPELTVLLADGRNIDFELTKNVDEGISREVNDSVDSNHQIGDYLKNKKRVKFAYDLYWNDW